MGNHDKTPPPGHALASVFQTLLEAGPQLERIGEIGEKLDALLSERRAATLLAMADEGLHPDRIYNVKQASAFLGVTTGTANNIPRELLPREQGRWRGIDIMAYRGDITHAEAAAYKDAKRASVLRIVRKAA